MAVGAGPFGEKFCELGDAMVGALVPNPCDSSGIEPIIISKLLQRRAQN